MTARPGDSFPTDLIFPPFVPRNVPQAPSTPPAPEASAPAAEAAPSEEAAEQPWAAADVEPSETELSETAGFAEFAQPGEEMPWDLPEAAASEDAAAQDDATEDLPWLELPEGSRASGSAAPEPWQPAAEEGFAEPEPWTLSEAGETPGAFGEVVSSPDEAESFGDTESFAAPDAIAGPESFAAPEAAAEPEDETGDAAAETVPDWMAWDPGTAAVTETPELPPPGDVEAAAAAREPEAVDPQALAGSLEGLESFDRSDVPAVEPVSGLGPVGDFDVPSEPAAAYETPDWAQPNPAWAAPSAAPSAADEEAFTGVAFGASSVDDELAAELRGIADAAVLGGTDEVETADDDYASPGVAGIASGVTDRGVEDAPVAAALQGDDRLGTMLGEVAGRLEAIARSLRERSPAEVLAGPSGGSADPLELLVTGFVLGYLQRGGR